ERGFGRWEGLTRDEVREQFGDARQPEGGEDWEMLRERMAAALAWVLERTPAGGATAVVGHGGSLKTWVGMALGWDRLDDERSHRLALGNGSVSVLLAEGEGPSPGLRLLRLNDAAHLED
ncbi:MAG: histidine phosphatase family protein, partial [Armatimonadota bacterium]